MSSLESLGSLCLYDIATLAASALVATVLVGCGKKGEETGAAAEGAKYAKAGLGVVSSYSDGKVNNKFQPFADYYGFKIQPCIAGHPHTKAKVEAPMKILDEIRAYNG